MPYSGDDEDLTGEAADLLANEASIIAVIGDTDDGARLIGAIGDGAPTTDLPDVIVNDQLRGQGSQPVIEGLSPQFRAKIKGVSPLAVSDRTDAPEGLFAANAFDCVNLIALSALSAESDNPSKIAAQMPAVSVGGRVCRTYADCADRLAQGLRIDYDGPSGNTELSTTTGSPTNGEFVEFTFTDDGIDVSGESFDVETE